jgi:hypothetical protein
MTCSISELGENSMESIPVRFSSTVKWIEVIYIFVFPISGQWQNEVMHEPFSDWNSE